MLEIGSVIDGKYKILNKIGQGGMSVVYLAMNEKANKQWAIKDVRKDGVKNFEVVKQGLIAETDILKRLSHPNLPSIVDIIDNEDSFLIVMDYIEGNSLSKALEEYGAIPEEYVVEWGKQICDVFHYLHTRKPAIIYRDLKPSNVMLKPDGNISIIDFGTAREYKEENKNRDDTTTLGTEGYAAPEQYGGRGQTDPRTDIYNLGATLYHLVTGCTPFKNAPPYYGMVPIRQINPMLSEGLEEIILKCTQQRPVDRYQNCLEVMYALEHYQESGEAARKRANKHIKTFVASAVMCGVLALAGTGTLSVSNHMRSESYHEKLEEALDGTNSLTNAQRIQDCREAIELRPEDIEGYEALLKVVSSTETCCNDANITPEEDEAMLIVSRNKVALKAEYGGDDRFGELCYDIGHAYWFNYNNENADESEKMSIAMPWFDDARNALGENNERAKLAKLYYDIGYYNIHIQELINQDEDKGRYLTYWQALESMLEVASEETNYAQLQMYRLTVNSVVRYYKQFANDGVKASEMLDVLDTVEEGLLDLQDQFTEGTNSDICQQTINSLDSARNNVEQVK